MSKIADIRRTAGFVAARQDLHLRRAELLDLITSIQQIPAPTFDEAQRAKFVFSELQRLGCHEVNFDDLNNVIARLPGRHPNENAPLVISAHLDTVFPLGTDLSVHRDGERLYGPGIGDNATGVGGLLFLIQLLIAHNLRSERDVWVVFNVGEEGLGDLCGMRAIVDRFGTDAIYIVLEGGLFGQLVHTAIGAQRYRVEVRAPGGHSWGNYGRASAIHEAARLITAIDALMVPEKPKTTKNIGRVQGGTSINTIAQTTEFLLDLRSMDGRALSLLVSEVQSLVEQANFSAVSEGTGVDIVIHQVGFRPTGNLPRRHPLVLAAENALAAVNETPVSFVAASTDANMPLSRGCAAVCVGLTVSANAHRHDEYIETRYLARGLEQLMLLTLSVAGLAKEDWQPGVEERVA